MIHLAANCLTLNIMIYNMVLRKNCFGHTKIINRKRFCKILKFKNETNINLLAKFIFFAMMERDIICTWGPRAIFSANKIL